MQASETKLQQIIEGTKQYLVPLFQRSYSWTKPEWRTLWDDIIELYDTDNPRPHFMGSIVTMPTSSSPEGVTKYVLIDGQQRLTTIFIILAVLRDVAKQKKQEHLAAEINDTLLINTYKQGTDRYKIQPTQIDRTEFYKIIDNPQEKYGKNIGECYKFFIKEIKNTRLDLAKLKQVICYKFSLVSILLGNEDDPYLVFESLNAKGKPLTQADLVRNYFFMKINQDQQEEVYGQYWQPMEVKLGDKMTDFLRHFLNKNSYVVHKENQIYFQFKDRIDRQETIESLKEVYTFSEYYAKLLNPELESQETLRKHLQRLNRLEIFTIYPFLLNCYDDWYNQKLSEDDFVEILKVIENFLLRRFVCDIPTNGLNKLFPSLYSQVRRDSDLNSETFVKKLKIALQQQNYPKDEQFREKLQQINLYGRNRSEKARFILESIELFFNHKESINLDSKIEVEHIMPQTLNQWWKEHLGEDYLSTHELFIHTLGNLTLTGYNRELSNSDFLTKRERYAKSNLELNKYIAQYNYWTRESIEARGEYLADIALKIWGYFGNDSITPRKSNSLKGKKPLSLTIFGEKYNVDSWRDILEITLNQIVKLDEDIFEEIIRKYSRFVSWDNNKFRSSRQLENGAFIEVNLSADDVYTICLRILDVSEISLEDWQLEVI